MIKMLSAFYGSLVLSGSSIKFLNMLILLYDALLCHFIPKQSLWVNKFLRVQVGPMGFNVIILKAHCWISDSVLQSTFKKSSVC